MGEGRGGGGMDNEAGVVAGGAVSAGLAVCFCAFGIPAVLAGIIMLIVAQSGSSLFVVGLVLIIVSAVCLFGGISVILVLCTGCCGKYNTNNNSVSPTYSHSAPPPMVMQPMQPPSYNTATAYPASSFPQPGQPGYSNPPFDANQQMRNGPAYPEPPSAATYDAPPSSGYPNNPPAYS